MKLYFDIGASNTRIGISGDDSDGFRETRIFPTETNFEDQLKALLSATQEIRGNDPFSAAAGGVAGPLNRDKSGILSSYLEDWINRPIRQELQKALDCPVILENDAALAGLGEAALGAGKGYPIVAYFTFSTGVGGARIVDGKIDRNAHGFEPRWQPAGLDSSNNPVFLDDLVSGHALTKRFAAKPEEIKDPARWEEVEKLITICLLNGIGFWSPDIIVIGGSIGESHSVQIGNLKHNIAQAMDYPVDIPIVKASLGQLNGLYGAKTYLKQLEEQAR